MGNTQKGRRLIAGMLLCAIMVCTFARPAKAVEQENTDIALSAPLAASQQASAINATRMTSVVRYSGYSGSAIIGCLEDGTAIKVLGTKGSFYKIDCYEMKGYIAKSQVEKRADGNYYVKCKADSGESRKLPTVSSAELLTLKANLEKAARGMLGVPYLWGGTSRRGIDCSGFTQYSYRKIGYTLNRTAVSQLENGLVVAKADMQPGDLVFFKNTTDNGRIATHVGIYLGDGRMIHSGSSKGVVVVSLSQDYWQQHFLCARRVLIPVAVAPTLTPEVEVSQDINSSYWRDNSQTQTESGNSVFLGI
jgi:cell wall-associated NlpC family hydrolase